MYFIGITSAVDTNDISGMSSSPRTYNQNCRLAREWFTDLNGMAAQIAAAVCGTSVSSGYSEATQATIATGDSGSVAG